MKNFKIQMENAKSNNSQVPKMLNRTMEHRTTSSEVFLKPQTLNLANISVSLYKCPLTGDINYTTYKWRKHSLLTAVKLYFSQKAKLSDLISSSVTL